MKHRTLLELPLIQVSVALLCLFVLPLLVPSHWLGILTEMLIMGILAMSLNLLMGYTGLLSLGHAGFFGTAAYVTGILYTRYGLGTISSALCGVLGGSIVAAVFGALVAHSTGVSFLLITMALGMCLWGLSNQWVSVTGGGMGITGLTRPEIGFSLDLYDDLTFYYFYLVIFILVLVAIFSFVQSPFGKALKGIRESESRMKALGYNTWLHKYLGFVVAGFFASVAGVMWAWHNEFVSPNDLDIMAGIKPVVMIIIGGVGTFLGPLAGSGIFLFLENFISDYTHSWQLIVGIILISIVFWAPMGLSTLVRFPTSQGKGQTIADEPITKTEPGE